MVEYTLNLDNVFASLADSTRRDILERVKNRDLSVGEIAKNYDLSFAAISKHLKVLEKAKLITKKRRGKEQIVSIAPETLADAEKYLQIYQRIWEERLDALDIYLSKDKEA